ASSSTAWTMTVLQAADPGPDGVVCTADDVHGAVLQFVSNAAVSPGAVPPIDYHVLVATDARDGTVALNTAVVSAPDNRQSAQDRTFVGYITLRSAAEVRIFKTADQPTVEVAPDQIGYTLTWSDTEATDVGKTQWIDVLPYVGDSRGSAFSGSLALASIDLHGATSGVTVEYTDATPSSVAPDPSAASNQPSGSTTWCTQSSFGSTGCPSSMGDVTAIRITINDLHSGDTGSLHLIEQPTGNVEGDAYANDVGPGRAAALQLAVPESNVVQVDVVASSIGRRVWLDANHDGIQDPGEAGLAGVTLDYSGTVGSVSVSGSVVTGADGVYTLPNLHSGTYRVVVDASTLPAGLVPTYDLDNGTVNPDGDSGDVVLAQDTDRTDVNFGYAPAPPPPPSSSTPPPSSSTPPPPPSSSSTPPPPPSSSSTPPPPPSSSSTPPPSSSTPPPPSSSGSPSTSATVLPTSGSSSRSALVEPSATSHRPHSGSGGALAVTGSDAGALLALAAALTACGALLLTLARRRKRHG
ncbi:MAG TPA: SdrD B-like domain-containing protein, partial [Jatrophihabitantaceae bacterium]|nr:SdrD B-like domain-containing protein [Jatrophihabitantaceae bacterium]